MSAEVLGRQSDLVEKFLNIKASYMGMCFKDPAGLFKVDLNFPCQRGVILRKPSSAEVSANSGWGGGRAFLKCSDGGDVPWVYQDTPP